MGNTVFWQIYKSTAYKYRKYRCKLEKSIANHSFHKFSRRKQNQLIRKVERLRNRLRTLSLQLKIAASGATMAILLSCGQVSAQSAIGPFVNNDQDNPLRPPIETGQYSAPVLVDFDKDGDLDLFVGTDYNDILYFQNVGSATEPKYLKPTIAEDPFENTTFPSSFGYSSPALADIDGDGDLDLVASEKQGLIYYFRNDNGKLALQSGANNPFDGFDLSIAGSPYAKITFADIDGDGDLDLYAGRDPAYASNIMEMRNNGDGTFTSPASPTWPNESSIDVVNPAPAFGDMDGDGDLDLIIGENNGSISYYRNQEVETGTIDFLEQTGPWDGTLGNPFNGLGTYNDAIPTFADVDGDGDLDVVVGLQYATYPSYQFEPVQYFKNNGSGNFSLLKDLNSPFDGVDVGDQATASFADTDNDGDLDVIMGGDFVYFSNYTTFYSFNDISGVNEPVRFENTTAALGNTPPFGHNNAPQYGNPIWADLDLDGDQDLVIADSGSPDRFLYFENQNGAFVEKLLTENPFDGIYFGSYYIYAEFADIDNDGDLDAFFSTTSFIYFYEDVGAPGSPHVPVYQLSTLNGDLTTTDFLGYVGYPKLTDVDHDGDLDAVVGTYQGILYFENIGTNSAPDFKLDNPNNPFAFMTDPDDNVATLLDVDKDGDWDLFVGQNNGRFKYFQNQNPPPITTPGISQMVYNYGSGPLVVDATIAIADADNDLITRAVVTVLGYQTGDILGFNPQGGVAGNFDTSTGVLTLAGLAPASTYQDILRSITYDYTGTKPTSSGRKGSESGRTVVVNKTLEFTVFDSDFTQPATSAVALQLTVANAIPTIATSSELSLFDGTAVIVDNALSVADGDDADLTGAVVRISSSTFVSGEDNLLFSAQNGITGSYISSTGVLTLTGLASVANYQTALRSVQYENTSSTPTGTNRTIEFIVDDGESLSPMATKSITIDINLPPVFTPQALTTVVNGQVTLDLLSIVTDPNDNLDPTTFTIIQQPISSATANIDIQTSILSIDYSSTSFVGLDNLIIEVFDTSGSRAETTINIQVDGNIIVHNGVSPNGDGKNDYFDIQNIAALGSENKVSIFNRWGDKVFEMINYNNSDRRFDGKSDSGKELSSGVYFYKIEFSNGQPELKGYLTIKR